MQKQHVKHISEQNGLVSGDCANILNRLGNSIKSSVLSGISGLKGDEHAPSPIKGKVGQNSERQAPDWWNTGGLAVVR